MFKSLFGGKKMDMNTQVCDCKKVTLGEIINVIKRYNLNDVDGITEYTEAGCCCKACVSFENEAGRVAYLEEILRDVKAGKY
jgi:bacterioferritin-associated ferredoxin